MSNSEGFIEEVTDELRRDRRVALARRWGWVPILAVLLLVGGAAWSEWSRNRAEIRAQAFGDAVLEALDGADMETRGAALEGVPATGPGQAAILALLGATAELNGEGSDGAAARAQLLTLAETQDLPLHYRHLAVLNAMLAGGTGEVAGDAALLEELAAPGAPFRTLAVEQQALQALDAGDEATAITLLRSLAEDAEATGTLRERAARLIVALGATPEPA